MSDPRSILLTAVVWAGGGLVALGVSSGAAAGTVPAQLPSGTVVDAPVPPGPPVAYPDTVPPAWFAGLWYERDFISSDLPQWTDWAGVRAAAVRELPRGAIGLELFVAERFVLRDRGMLVDAYGELWNRAYGNLRLRVTPGADVLPGKDVRGELFQAWPGGWELSGSGWWMDFPEHDATVLGVGLARYLGSWYLREVVTLGRLAGESALSARVLARRYLHPPREYVEVSGGVGKEVVVLGAGPVVDVRGTRFVQAGLQKFLTPTWGVAATLAYNRFQGAPSRRGGSVGVLARF